MIYGSVCSGIEAATVAWHPLGWTPAWFSEIDPFPASVLAHHFPGIPNHGDFTTISAAAGAGIDLLVGGTPCQSFSLAGLRGGLADERGNLALEFLRLADRCAPRWVVWENVPGVLSSNGGRDFGSFLGALGELGYGWAYRVLDAQHFGVPQRRRRVFVVGCLGDWRAAGAVLFERPGLPGNPSSRRASGAEAAGSTPARARGSSRSAGREADRGAIAQTLTAHPGGRYDLDTETFVAHALTATDGGANAERDTLIPFDTTQITSKTNRSRPEPGDPCHPLAAQGHPPAIASRLAVRRIIPLEAERLQGLPDHWTAIPGAKDGPRYKAIGNSMAVPVMRWIGERIQQAHLARLLSEGRAA